MLLKKMKEYVTPDDIFDSVCDITVEYLQNHFIEGVVLDLDNTLVPRSEDVPSLQCLSWVEDLKSAGIRLCIATNNSNKNRVIKVSNYLDIPAVCRMYKPLPYLMRKVLADLIRLPAEKVLMVGDQHFSDIIGGNLVGMRTVYIAPLEFEAMYFRKLLLDMDKNLYEFFQE
ncbi:MAG: YqeG family HAD IIIA-type phosphatase [Candidatus Margulisiibacteriota bacterium]|nr:MAG: hypothetical protein A2X43_02325 [Candidatus Margulisbacteria bacterium GWD2_39_127]OGI01196.1 MAG: hypothetical protein A2X42_06160 [Candidatus Margulisbacteria bacterium GWF2_38_17]OGI09831.1 MAG: hypothetical protein A2X41_09880 [Candidatus Margulisbacteria bacterium GWE2_39_32]PZM78420.1 MAG: YqeG family HAD IIIA-type phosphatase [Candidatus Margulisiibacteriota bacterium]HAR62392.1 YqeG family HAD IIIA-type phosphatase [Candidatus Margulisiibacteriota bacterium]